MRDVSTKSIVSSKGCSAAPASSKRWATRNLIMRCATSVNGGRPITSGGARPLTDDSRRLHTCTMALPSPSKPMMPASGSSSEDGGSSPINASASRRTKR